MIEPKHEASLLAEEKSLWAGQMFVIMLIIFLLNIKGGYFQFGLVFIKKSNQNLFFFLKRNRNRFKPTGFGSVTFNYFGEKTGLARFFFGLIFSVSGL
jgi:hypothetical protein